MIGEATAEVAVDAGIVPVRAEVLTGSSHTNDLILVTPVPTLTDTWRHMVSARTGRLGAISP